MWVEVTEKAPKKVLRYAGRNYAPGAQVDMRDNHARLFVALGHVRPYQREDMTAEDADTKRPKRQYRRRDMQAE